jgi:hypothetical protein
MYSSTLSLTSAIDMVGGQRHSPAALPPGKIRYPLYRRLGSLTLDTSKCQEIHTQNKGSDPRVISLLENVEKVLISKTPEEFNMFSTVQIPRNDVQRDKAVCNAHSDAP